MSGNVGTSPAQKLNEHLEDIEARIVSVESKENISL
jgi:hypothetical protein